MTRLAGAVVALVAVWLIVSELAMQPTGSDRVALYGIFGTVTVATVLAGWWLRSRRFSKLGTALRVVALSSVVVAASAVAVSALSMFINTHDLNLVLIALGLGVALALALAVSVTSSITADLDRLAAAAAAVGAGDLAVRTGIDRPDEIGDAARTVDEMIERLAALDAERTRDEAARKDFLAAVSHDLRTPLAALRAGIEALEDDMVDDPGRLYKALSSGIDALGRLIDDLSMLATVEAGGVSTDRVDVAELADETVEAMAPVAAVRQVTLRTEADGATTATADATALSRVLRNLVDNAIKYGPDGGRVGVVTTGGVDRVTVRVVDEGAGFPTEFRATAFDRFTRYDAARSSEGSGLGLAIARGVVEAHGGEIWIADDGVAFWIPA